MLEALSTREVVTELPIYKFSMLEVEKEDGSKALAITCIADPDTFGYFGDGLSELEKDRLNAQDQKKVSLYKKASIIAAATGKSKKFGHYTTCKSYFDRFVRYPLQQNPVNTDQTYLGSLNTPQRKRQIALAAEQERLLTLASKIDERRTALQRENPQWAAELNKAEKFLWSRCRRSHRPFLYGNLKLKSLILLKQLAQLHPTSGALRLKHVQVKLNLIHRIGLKHLLDPGLKLFNVYILRQLFY